MSTTNVSERVKLCAARSLGLAENLNDALVLIDGLDRAGIIDIELPEQSTMKSITGHQFLQMLEKALIQFDDDGSWVDLTREEVEEAGGSVDDIRGPATIYYRVAQADGSIPDPPRITETRDRLVVFHPTCGYINQRKDHDG